MRWSAALFSIAMGCGRVGFELCSGCNTQSGTVARVQAVAPGSMSLETLALPITAAAGQLVLLAIYMRSPADRASVDDTAGSTWATLPLEVSPCGDYSGLRLWYAVIDHGGDDTITVHDNVGGALTFGAVATVYAGVDPDAPIDVASGQVAAAATGTFVAGTLDATGDGMMVAAFADATTGPVTLVPGTGAHGVAHDDAYVALVEDQVVGAGSYTPQASLPSGKTSMCWTGASVVLRAR